MIKQPWAFKLEMTNTTAMADTSSQSCLASMMVIHLLSLCKDDLIPVTMHMNAANNDGIKILISLTFSPWVKPSTLQPRESPNWHLRKREPHQPLSHTYATVQSALHVIAHVANHYHQNLPSCLFLPLRVANSA